MYFYWDMAFVSMLRLSQIEAIKPFAQGLVFIKTHSNPVAEQIFVCPDIGGYNEDRQPLYTGLNRFLRVSIFVELKKSHNQCGSILRWEGRLTV